MKVKGMVKNAVLVALVAVGLTAATTEAAKLVTGKQVANNSLTGADVKNGSLGTRDLNGPVRKALRQRVAVSAVKGEKGDKGDKGEPGIGIQGPMGPTGPRGDVTNVQGDSIVGPKGDKGDPGPQGPAGRSQFVKRVGSTVLIAAGDEQQVEARCDSGEVAVSGTVGGFGGYVSHDALEWSNDPQFYAVTVHNMQSWGVYYTAQVVCAK